MSDLILTTFSSAGVSVALSGLLVFLFRSWIGERLRGAIQAEYAGKLEALKSQLKANADIQLESHKAVLKAQSDVELERLRARLAITASERQVHLGGLVPRRFDAIAATHGNLLRFQQAVAEMVQGWEFTGGPTREERAKEVSDAFDAFRSDHLRQKIYLTQPIADRVDAIGQSLLSSANVYTLLISRHQGMHDQWMEVLDRVTKDVPATMKVLEAELRTLLGDPNQLTTSDQAQVAAQ
ncbi:hypothetical protein [Paraburkholderia bannensis]|uniref:hypothetical protein n=1 Tax=Paraburkholderia bannensis TaxID=765414 RepID=UPI002AB31E45|nr:hypothetical protein [Paraburkholderia bannensis]